MAIIAPHTIALAALGDCQFALAQEVNEHNEGFYRLKAEQGELVILDHGAFELGRAAFDNVEYMEIAERVGATIVIAPDVQWNPHATFFNSSVFRDWFRSEGYHHKFKLMSVVWSSGPGDFGYWFQQHLEDINPDIYGIGKWYESMYADGSRAQLIRGLEQNYGVKPEQLHALGCPYAKEVYELRHLVRSMDTGIATKAALQGIHLKLHPDKRITPAPLKELNEGEFYLAKKNAEYILHLAQIE